MLAGRSLNKSIPVPLYYQLKTLVLEEIESGAFPVDAMIPTENELSDMFGISRTTVRQAITELVQEGRLYRVKSKGTFVMRPKIHQDFIRRLESYNASILRTGRTPDTKLLAFCTLPASDEVAAALKLSPGAPTVYCKRLRGANGVPVVLVETSLPYERCAFVLDHNLETESLYGILASFENTRICRVNRIVEAVAACAQDASALEIKRGSPVHLFHSTGFNGQGDPIEYSVSRYRGDQNRFEADVFVQTGP